MARPEAGNMVTPSVKLVREIGGGGMGRVWLAEHTTLHTTVVVKFLSPEYAENDDARERFSREASAAAQVRSSDIELGDDESITLVCSRVMNRAADGSAVEWRGDITLKDHVYLFIADYYASDDKTPAPTEPDADALAVSAGARALLGTTTARAVVSDIHGASLEYVGGKVVKSTPKGSVIDRLRQPGRVDLATEIAQLRAAILSLHDRFAGPTGK